MCPLLPSAVWGCSGAEVTPVLGRPIPGGWGTNVSPLCPHCVPRDGFEQDVEGSSGLTGTCPGEGTAGTSGDVGSGGNADHQGGIKGGSWGQCWGGGTEEYLGTLGDVGNIGGVGRHPGPLGTAGDTRGTFGIHWGGHGWSQTRPRSALPGAASAGDRDGDNGDVAHGE